MTCDGRRRAVVPFDRRWHRVRGGWVVTLLFWGASATAASAVTSVEERCVTTLNRAVAKVAATVAKEVRSCLKDAGLERLSGSVVDCFAEDRRGRIARTVARTIRDEAQACSGVTPSFGATSADIANAAAVARTVDLMHRLLGGDVEGAVRTRADDLNGYTCQQKVIQDALKCQELRGKEFNRCQQFGMRTGDVASAADLAGCIGADLVGRVAKSCDPVTGRLGAQTIPSKCVAKGTDLRAAFPGCATDDPAELAACLTSSGRCYSCLMVETADGLEEATDCDLFDDGELSAVQGSISPELDTMIAAADPTARIPVLIPLAEQADLSGDAIVGRSKTERLSQVVAALKATAAQTQNRPYGCGGSGVGLIGELEGAGADAAANIRSLWLTNAVAVEATAAVITQCAARADVGQVEYAGAMPSAEMGGATAQTAQASSEGGGAEPEWNIAQIRAPEVWGTLTEGSDVVVGIVGSGVDATHPDLAANMLTRPDGTPIWRDLIGGSATPIDDHGQGTHLTGVAVGANGIGVAPSAEWAACRAFRKEPDGSLSAGISDLVECLQFLMDPDGNGESTHAADVIVNPWWLPVVGCRHQLLGAVRNLRTANILPFFAVGHPPGGLPGVGVPNPANYPEAFSVGASDRNDPTVMLETSYRGTADCALPTDPVLARLAPRLFAPGVDVSSAWPDGGRAVLIGNPEGVAAAHAAGAAALVLSAHPVLTVDQLDDALERTAVLSDPGDEAGRGLLDVLAAATLEEALFVDQEAPPISPPPLAGGPRAVTIRMLNDGVTTWTQGVHHLMSMSPPNNTTWGPSRVELPTVEVLPGDIVALDFDVTVPGLENLSPGYPFQWQMARDAVVFGQPSPRLDVPVRGVPNSAFIQQALPGAPIPPDGTAAVSVTFRNVGSTVWDSTYGIAFQKPGAPWGVTRVWIPGGVTVPPCAEGMPQSACQHSFAFTLTASSIQGSYPFQWRMVRNAGGEQPFGQYGTDEPIPVDGTDVAVATGSVPPLDLFEIGANVSIWSRFRNDGTNTWLAGQYCERALEPEWGGAKKCVLANVAPSDTNPYPLTVVPQNPGRWALSYQMHDEDGLPFGAIGSTTVPVAWDHLASAGFSGTQGQGYWSYRYYDANSRMWKEMDWDGANYVWTRGAGRIWADLMKPRDGSGVARFWKSPVNGIVQINGDATHFLGCTEGDGVKFKIKHNMQLLQSGVVRWGSDVGYTHTVNVQVNDTLRFIVKPRSNNMCDIAVINPFVRVLPPDTVGPIVVNPINYLRDEPGDEDGTD